MRIPRRPSPDAGWYPWAGILLLAGPIWLELYEGGYPRTPELWLLPLAGGIVGWLGATLARRLPEPGATLCYAILVAVFLDLQFDPERYLPPLVMFGVALLVATVLRRRRASITVVVLGAFYLSSVPVGWRGSEPTPRATADRRHPILLHVVLDAQWGPAAFRAAGDTTSADELSDFYARRGFRVYEGAYSRYSATRWSLGSLVGLGGVPRIEPASATSFRVAENPYFDALQRAGYDLRVFQTSHLDFCRHPAVARCLTASATSIANVGYLRGDWRPRAALVFRFYLNVRSELYRRLVGRESDVVRRSAAARAVAFAETARRTVSARDGDAYFVHLMIPHAPFEVGADCQGHRTLAQRLADNDRANGTRRLSAYGAQSRCAQRLVAGFLATLDSTVPPGESIVLIHGDHGSKLADPGPILANYDGPALAAYFSTFFAIRAPGLSPAIRREPIAIQALLATLVASGFTRDDPGSSPPYVLPGPGDRGQDTIRLLDPRELPWISPPPLVAARPADEQVRR
jgi:hypothetical protein